MENKKNVLIYAIVSAILLIVGVIIGYKFMEKKEKDYSKNINTTENEKTNEDNNKNTDNLTKELTMEEQKELTALINKLDIIDLYHHNIDENTKLTDNEILWFGFKMLNKSIESTISLQELKKEINKYLDVTINPTDIYMYINRCSINDVPYFLYNSSTQTFKLNQSQEESFACSEFKMSVLNKIGESSKKSNTYTVTVYKAYSKNDDYFGAIAYYNDFSLNGNEITYSNKLFDVEWTEEGELVTDLNAELNKINNSKLTKVTYTFEKISNNYILKSYVIN